MKKIIHHTLSALSLVLFLNLEIKSQTKLIHYWHFNNVPGGVHLGTGKLNSDYTRAGTTTGYLRNVKLPAAVKDTGYWDNGTPGDTTNQRPGFGGCCSAGTPAFVRTRNPNDSMQFLWYIPTKNFKNIIIKYGSQSSSTGSGPGRQKYEYSTDSGATFLTTGLPRLFDSAGTAFGKIILDLSGITSVNNTNKLMIRIRTTAPNTGASGNTRYDNITVEGDSIATVVPTGINEKTGNANGYNLYPNPSKDLITLSTPFSGQKTISVINMVGQIVLTVKQEGKDIPIDISDLNNGIYFVRINEQSGETKTTLKFVKN